MEKIKTSGWNYGFERYVEMVLLYRQNKINRTVIF